MQTVQIPEPGDLPDTAAINERLNAVQAALDSLQSRLANLPDDDKIGNRIADLEQGLSECHDAVALTRDQLTRLTPPDLTEIHQTLATLQAKLSALENQPTPSPARATGDQPPTIPQPSIPPAPAAATPTLSAADPTATPISPLLEPATPAPATPNPDADAGDRPVARPAPKFRPGHRLI